KTLVSAIIGISATRFTGKLEYFEFSFLRIDSSFGRSSSSISSIFSRRMLRTVRFLSSDSKGSAPRSRRSLITSRCKLLAASMMGVTPLHSIPPLSFINDPLSNNIFTISR
ncbi:hypothetical protein MXB_5587, partial [Myxobolus squamalis]